MVYGNFKKPEVTENDICEPLGIYAALKYSAEKIIKAYNQTFDLPYTILRPSALYGERCISRRVGQIFIENAIRGQKISINGDGEEKLDFTYIKDLLQGISLAIENKNSVNQTFNITYGSARKISDLIEILKNHFNEINIEKKPRDKFMPERGTLDIDKAKNLLGYKPGYSIDNGYNEYIEWYKDFFHKSK